MRYTTFLLLLLSLMTAPRSYAQQRVADSLKKELATVKTDTGKVALLYGIGQVFEEINADSAEKYYEAGYVVAKKANYMLGRYRYYGNITSVLDATGKFEESIRLNKEGLALAKVNGPVAREGIFCANIGNSYMYMERWDSSAAYYMRALKIFEDSRDTMKIALAYSNLSNAYSGLANLPKALEYASMAAEMSRGKDELTYMSALDNMGNYLMDLYHYDESMKAYAEAEAIARRLNATNVLANIIAAYADINNRTNNYPKMLLYARRFDSLVGKLGNDNYTLRSYYGLARSYFFNKDLPQAERYLDSATVAAKAQKNITMLKKCYTLGRYIALVRQNFPLFNFYDDKADSLSIITTNDNILKITQDYETKYETAKKETRIHLQEIEIQKRHAWNMILAASLLSITIITLLSIRTYKNKEKLLLKDKEIQQQVIARLEQEQQLSATKAVLQGQDEERVRLAKDLHDGLGGMLSGIKFSFSNMKDNMIMTPDNHESFERSMTMLDSSIRELRRVAHNMMPESLVKFGLDAAISDLCDYVNNTGAIKCTYQSMGLSSLAIDNNVSVNIYRVIQELMNNTMKHAAASGLLVQVMAEGSHISVTVEDNGKGFDTTFVQTSSGIGWASIRNRVSYLKGTLDVRSSADKGTSVLVEFNI